MGKPEVSIVIVSYNTKDLLLSCIDSIGTYASVATEIIVSDNGSTDGTIEALEANKRIVLIQNKENLGFAKGNNIARKIAQGKYILFLNPDTLLHKDTLPLMVKYLKENADVGAVTCKVILPGGELDRDTRRSFPTPFISLTHFSGLDRVFPRSRLFSKYWYGYLSEDVTHKIDAMQGAFFLSPKIVLDRVQWFDEDYFLDGEDIDLCWKIQNAGYKLMYVPTGSITHIKKASKKKNKSLRSVIGGVVAMEIFYKKRLWNKYPLPVNLLVLLGIRILKIIRTVKYHLV